MPRTSRREGGYVVCPNHYSYLEPLVFGHFLVDHGHSPRYLGKVEVFKAPVVGAIVRNADQIPVYRESGRAADAYRAAVAAVRAGKGVAIYPEGTLTRDPDLWPMRGKTGAARVALETRCPVVPVATWGAQEILAPYCTRLRLLPRRTMQGARRDAGAARRPARHASSPAEVLARGHGPDHGGDHRRARGAARREGPGRPLRPPRPRRDVHRQAPPPGGGLMTSAAVYGTGSWGTAFASVLADAGTSVTMWGRRAEVVEQINAGVNEDYLPELRLPSTIRATTDPAEAGRRRRHRRARRALADPARQPHRVGVGAAAVGGRRLAHEGRRARHDQADVRGHRRGRRRRGRPDRHRLGPEPRPRDRRQAAGGLGRRVGEPAHGRARRRGVRRAVLPSLHRRSDVVGTEIAGAVKNVIALAVGMVEGLGMGDNSKASIITRGLAETMRLGIGPGGRGASPSPGSPGVGDLIATCMSPLSRNHSFGVRLGQGMAVSEVVAVTKQTAEGVKSCTSILELARKNGVDVPIIEQVDAMIQHDRTAQEVVAALLSRPRKAETA